MDIKISSPNSESLEHIDPSVNAQGILTRTELSSQMDYALPTTSQQENVLLIPVEQALIQPAPSDINYYYSTLEVPAHITQAVPIEEISYQIISIIQPIFTHEIPSLAETHNETPQTSETEPEISPTQLEEIQSDAFQIITEISEVQPGLLEIQHQVLQVEQLEVSQAQLESIQIQSEPQQIEPELSGNPEMHSISTQSTPTELRLTPNPHWSNCYPTGTVFIGDPVTQSDHPIATGSSHRLSSAFRPIVSIQSESIPTMTTTSTSTSTEEDTMVGTSSSWTNCYPTGTTFIGDPLPSEPSAHSPSVQNDTPTTHTTSRSTDTIPWTICYPSEAVIQAPRARSHTSPSSAQPVIHSNIRPSSFVHTTSLPVIQSPHPQTVDVVHRSTPPLQHTTSLPVIQRPTVRFLTTTPSLGHISTHPTSPPHPGHISAHPTSPPHPGHIATHPTSPPHSGHITRRPTSPPHPTTVLTGVPFTTPAPPTYISVPPSNYDMTVLHPTMPPTGTTTARPTTPPSHTYTVSTPITTPRPTTPPATSSDVILRHTTPPLLLAHDPSPPACALPTNYSPVPVAQDALDATQTVRSTFQRFPSYTDLVPRLEPQENTMVITSLQGEAAICESCCQEPYGIVLTTCGHKLCDKCTSHKCPCCELATSQSVSACPNMESPATDAPNANTELTRSPSDEVRSINVIDTASDSSANSAMPFPILTDGPSSARPKSRASSPILASTAQSVSRGMLLTEKWKICYLCGKNPKNMVSNCGHSMCRECMMKSTECKFCKAPITKGQTIVM